MTYPTYNNRRLIWESKIKQIWLILISFLFVAAAIWTKEKYSFFMFWGTMVFFGGSGLFFLVRLLNPQNLFVTHDTALGKEILADQFKQQQEDLGFFSYDDTGFSLTEHKGVTYYNWTDIETVFGYKVDNYTTDEICLDIFTYSKHCLTLTESTPGWYQFNDRLTKYIPSISSNWDREIAVPAFETKLTLLFDKKGRSLNEVQAEYRAALIGLAN
jgi:hypothetical protein